MRNERPLDDCSKLMHMVRVQAELVAATSLEMQRRLLPRRLRRYFRGGITLDVNQKDSVKGAISCWIAELGELDATFTKSSISHLKSFMSQLVDYMRLPYARSESGFQRRTSFAGTVNEKGFLRDKTGNRRYLPVAVENAALLMDEAFVDQLWAEAWLGYTSGEQWWPTTDEQACLDAYVDGFVEVSNVAEALSANFDWDKEPEKIGRHAVTDILRMLGIRDTVQNSRDAREAIPSLWESSGLAERKNGKLCFAGHLVYQRGGRNRGYLMPPPRIEFEEVKGEEDRRNREAVKT
jgi:hypothetical protein